MPSEDRNEDVVTESPQSFDNDNGDVTKPKYAEDFGKPFESNGNQSKNSDFESKRESLNAVYGNRLGFLQSMSMILNAGLMVYAHIGVSGVIVSNQQRIDTSTSSSTTTTTTTISTVEGNNTNGDNATNALNGLCTLDDLEIWNNGGEYNRTSHSDWCSRQYVYNGRSCLTNVDCIAECFNDVHGYTQSCSTCFAAIVPCALRQGCAFACADDGLSERCQNCNAPCTEAMFACTGLPETEASERKTEMPSALNGTESNSTSIEEDDGTASGLEQSLSNAEICQQQREGVDLESVDRNDMNIVYELTFFGAIKDAWFGGAKLLAIIVMLFSGVWPYTKNIIIMFAWYMPMTARRRTLVLQWLKRLGKYTLVDIYAVIIILVGVAIEANVAAVPVVVAAEPRPGIIAFFLATVWEFAHFEWMTELHQQHFLSQTGEKEVSNNEKGIMMALRFSNSAKSPFDASKLKNQFCGLALTFLLLVATIALYIVGCVSDCVRFTTYIGEDNEGCEKSYSLYTLGSHLVSDFSLDGNTAKPGVWTLFVAYFLLLAVCPIVTHMVHAMVIVFNIKNHMICRIADVCWSFASVEILLIGIFTIQYKFSELIGMLAGEESADFLSIEAELGTGFVILFVYSVTAGLLHYFFNSAVSEYFQIDPYHKIDWLWTKTFGFLLESADN